MSLNEWADISTIIQGFAVVVSLGFILYQLRQTTYQLQQTTQLAKAANVQSLTEQAAAFNSMLFGDPELAELWYSYGKDIETVDRADFLRYREMLVQWLIMHQNIFYQAQRKLLDSAIYDGWCKDLENTVYHHNLAVVAADLKSFFPGEFGDRLMEISRRIGTQSSPVQVPKIEFNGAPNTAAQPDSCAAG